MIKTFSILLVLTYCISTQPLFAQEWIVDLEEPSPSDNSGYNLVFLEPKSSENFVLPEDTTGALFLNLEQYNVEGDRKLSLLFIPSELGQLVYVDRNNDENLTNDGNPLFFPHEENALDFSLLRKDGQNTSPFRLEKIPSSMLNDDKLKSLIVDDQGRLQDSHFKVWKIIKPAVSKERNFFFHETSSNLRRGVLELGAKNIEIGLFDYTLNGSFDDIDLDRPLRSDWLLIDMDGDGKLIHHQQNETFFLDEVIRIDGKNYKLKNLDPEGNSLTLIETEKKNKRLFLKAMEAESESNKSRTQKE